MHGRVVATEPCNNHVREPRYTIEERGWIDRDRSGVYSACIYRVYIDCSCSPVHRAWPRGREGLKNGINTDRRRQRDGARYTYIYRIEAEKQMRSGGVAMRGSEEKRRDRKIYRRTHWYGGIVAGLYALSRVMQQPLNLYPWCCFSSRGRFIPIGGTMAHKSKCLLSNQAGGEDGCGCKLTANNEYHRRFSLTCSAAIHSSKTTTLLPSGSIHWRRCRTGAADRILPHGQIRRFSLMPRFGPNWYEGSHFKSRPYGVRTLYRS